MQSKLFEFIALPGKNSDADLQVLMDTLEKLRENNFPLSFKRKEELLLSRLDDVSFYISILKSKNELKDWFQIAKDFELKIEKEHITKEGLLKRYDLWKSASKLYQESHYTTALLIMDEMEKFNDAAIYSFQ